MSALNEYAFCKVATLSGIDATLTGSTELYKIPDGKSFIPLGIVIRVTSFTSGGKTIQAIASFAGNASDYNDHIDSHTFTISLQNYFLTDGLADEETIIQVENTSYRISIETASDATTEVWAIDIFGYLI